MMKRDNHYEQNEHGQAITLLRQSIDAAKEERRRGFAASVDVYKDKEYLTIDTYISRDPNRSRNGGEYNFWTVVQKNDWGEAIVEECWSCDFATLQHEPYLIRANYVQIQSMVEMLALAAGVPVNYH